jgi:tRNA(fMet)-specific endonuclease VapC
MNRFMLDTNIVSHLLKEHPAVTEQILHKPMANLCISVLTEAELLFGLAKRPERKLLHAKVAEFLKRMTVLAWDSAAAAAFAQLRVKMERQGRNLSPFDLLIAAHALSLGAVLVTSDHAFRQVSELTLEDWTTA